MYDDKLDDRKEALLLLFFGFFVFVFAFSTKICEDSNERSEKPTKTLSV